LKGRKIEKPENMKEIIIDLQTIVTEEDFLFYITKMPFSRFGLYLGISARNEDVRYTAGYSSHCEFFYRSNRIFACLLPVDAVSGVPCRQAAHPGNPAAHVAFAAG
jgi:hypothetical protein